ncbi:NepR family anti-sigma factor [Oceanicaulis alexandrii]|uniref:NepR family anti-sigma factor n=2 Tax=Oceanicaulis TaxID=153232 RepID=UPI00389914C6|tara:strand:+ start:1392 stop:1610 length:219 start_codon:yes stop_codon:yes gene_type:complete
MAMSEDKNRSGGRPDPALVQRTRKQQETLGAGLRHMFDSVVDEGVPDAFADLLDRLEQSESDRTTEKGDGHE